MKKLRNFITSLLVVALCCAVVVTPAAAYGRVDVDADISLTMQYKRDETPLTGMNIRMYKVLEMSEAVRFTFADAFKDYAGILDLTNPEPNWPALATTVSGYIVAAEANGAPIPVTAEGQVDEDGFVKFEKDSAGQKLDAGIYLITGDPAVIGKNVYTPKTFFMTLPLLSNEVWNYDAVLANKFEFEKDSKLVSMSVVKQWSDGNSSARPTSVTVTLYENGKPYDDPGTEEIEGTVTLSADNNWQHTWNDVDGNSSWTLVEENIPARYTATVDRLGSQFLVTNRIRGGGGGGGDDDDPTPPPPEEDIPDEDVPLAELPDENPPLIMLPDEEPPLAMLPQTGIPWLPVQLLAMAGVMLFALGYIVLRIGRRKEDEA